VAAGSPGNIPSHPSYNSDASFNACFPTSATKPKEKTMAEAKAQKISERHDDG
jgi:hypothetical protein